MHFPPRAGRPALLAAVLALTALRAPASAQQKPAEITAAQSTELPYRLSGRLNVTFGNDDYFGTATYIRRYTGITAGHLLYDPKGGMAHNVYYEPALYQEAATTITVGAFAVLSGYQSAADDDPDSDPAFDYDMGYVLFNRPAPNAEWADFMADTGGLTDDVSFLVLGYGYEKGVFQGNKLEFVNVAQSYDEVRAPALFSNSSYYTLSGMSGGPLYVRVNPDPLFIAAVNVAGTDLTDPALSGVRAITGAEQNLFTEAEYSHGLIVAATLKGPTALPAGGVGNYKVGAVFKDGMREGSDLPRRYGELYLAATGAHKKQVSIRAVRTGRFQVTLADSLVSGDVITLSLFRGTVSKAAQTPFKTLTVTVQ